VRKAYGFPSMPPKYFEAVPQTPRHSLTNNYGLSERRSLSARKAAKPRSNQTSDSASVKDGITSGRLPNPNQRRMESTKMMIAAAMMIAVSPVLM
jgi:hypothetical protein